MKIEVLEAILKEVAATSTQERKVFHEPQKQSDVSIGRIRAEGTKKLYNYSCELKMSLSNLHQKAILIANADDPQRFVKKLKEMAKKAVELYTKAAITDILFVESINEEFGIYCLSKHQCNTIRVIDGWEVIKQNCRACLMKEIHNERVEVIMFNQFSQN